MPRKMLTPRLLQRIELMPKKKQPTNTPTAKPARVRNIHFPVMMTADEKALFESAADNMGLALATWIRLVCTQVARGDRKANVDL